MNGLLMYSSYNHAERNVITKASASMTIFAIPGTLFQRLILALTLEAIPSTLLPLRRTEGADSMLSRTQPAPNRLSTHFSLMSRLGLHRHVGRSRACLEASN